MEGGPSASGEGEAQPEKADFMTDDPMAATEQFMTVVDKTMQEKKVAPRFAKKAWCILDRDGFPRKQAIAIVENPYFDAFILGLIVANCGTMLIFNEPVLKRMIESHPDDYATRSTWAAHDRNVAFFKPMSSCTLDDPGPCSIADYIDWVFLMLFTVEMVIKMIASGLILHPHAYLRSGWNWLDFIVVTVGLVETYTSGLPGISTLRLVKTLRPLRSLQRIRGMRVLVQCILEAMPQMCNVLLFLSFFIFFFALIGISLFKNGLRYSCHTLSDDGVTWESTDSICRPHCTWSESDVRLQGECKSLGNTTFQMESFDPLQTWDWVYSCRAGQQCLCTYNGLPDPTCDYRSNPNHGITSFDSIPWAIISLFQAISLEGWVDMMYQLQDGVSSWVWVYFVALVLFGAIIVLNLFLAVLCDNFEMADKEDAVDEEAEEAAEKEAAKELDDLSHTNPLRQAVLNLVRNKYFDWFVQFCILLNTLIMTMRYSAIPTDDLKYSLPDLRDTEYIQPMLYWFMFVMNIVLTTIFTLESVFKIIGFGPKLFARDLMNDFDFVVVAISIFEIAIDPKVCGTEELSSLVPLPVSVLRAFRIFRLFKLARSVGSIRKILATLIQSMASVFYLALLLLLMILIFVLLGMELFGGYYPRPELNYTAGQFPNLWDMDLSPDKAPRWEDEASRYHFDDPGNACLAIFVVLSGENWNEIMFHTHEASWDANMAAKLPLPYAIMYFLLLFFVGNLLLFNLFIAILLSNFDDDEDEEEEAAEEAPPEKEAPMMEWRFNGYVPSTPGEPAHSDGTVPPAATISSTGGVTPRGGAAGDDEKEKPPLFPAAGEDTGGDRSLLVFTWSNPLRVLCARIVTHPYFEGFIVMLILISTALMLLEMPSLKEDHWSRQLIYYCNIFFTVVFTLEMIFKWIAQGVVSSKTPKHYVLGDAYFRGAGARWNMLDFFIVVISLLMLANLRELKPLRAFRAFRPLRLVQRYEDLKITVATLFMSVPAIGSLISVATLFFLIFAILGVELYGGKLGSCADPAYEDMPYGSRVIPGMNGTQTDYEECMALPRYNITRRTTHGILLTDMADMFPNAQPNWLVFTEFPQWFYPQFGNFDNLALSIVLLFEISALEGWPDVMHVCMDTDQNAQFVVPWKIASDQDMSAIGSLGGVDSPMGDNVHLPQTGITAIFFIAWIIIGCFVVVNMTVGIVCDTFSKIKNENDGLLLMSEDAADWVKMQKQIFAKRPLVTAPPPTEGWRLPVYHLVTSMRFEYAIMVAILLNVLQMGCDFWEPMLHEYDTGEVGGGLGDPNSPGIANYKMVMTAFNWIFLAIYLCEMVLKWVGLGPMAYFKNPPDLFDFILVLISTVEAVLSVAGGATVNIGFIRVLRIFRVLRILRVIKSAKPLRAIVMTVIISVPALKNILVLIFLLITITDVLCVSLFSFVNYTPGNLDWSPDHAESIARGEVMPDPDNNYYYSGDGTNWGDQINRHANFQYFWTGLLVLVRSSTGESFNGIMHDLYSWSYGNNRMKCCLECGPMLDGDLVTYTIVRDALGNIIPGETVTMVQPESSCGDTVWGLLIYGVFQNAMAYIVLSIMIGVILDNFADVGSESRKVRIDDIEEFREVWLKYDPKGTFHVPSHNLLAILQQLHEPLGFAGVHPPLTRAEMLKRLITLQIPDHNGHIHFTETLTALANSQAGTPVPLCKSTEKIQVAATRMPKLSALGAPEYDAATSYFVSAAQAKFRGYVAAQKKLKESQVAPSAS